MDEVEIRKIVFDYLKNHLTIDAFGVGFGLSVMSDNPNRVDVIALLTNPDTGDVARITSQ